MEYFPSTLSRQASDAGIDAWQAQFAEKGWNDRAVELRGTGEFTGFIGLSVPVRVLPFSPGAEIGWRLDRAHWGNGFATEGASGAGHARRDDAAVMVFDEGVSLPKSGG